MTDAARLLNEGEPITLADGRIVTLRYGMRSIAMLERKFGGLSNISTAISKDGSGPVIDPTCELIACGLLHEHDGAGAPLTADRLLDLLDLRQIEAYTSAAGRALDTAFPAELAGGQGNETGETAAPDSPSPSGTTQAPSLSVAPTPSSG